MFAHVTTAGMLTQLLQVITSQVPADFACVYAHNGELATLGEGPPTEALAYLMRATLARAEKGTLLIPDFDLTDTNFASALMFPLEMDDFVIGVLALLGHTPEQFNLTQADALREQVGLVQALVQNLVMSEALQMAQNNIELLREQQANIIQGRTALLDAIADGVAIVLPGAGTTRVMSVNARFRDMFGVPPLPHSPMTLAQLIEAMRIPHSLQQELSEQWISTPLDSDAVREGAFSIISPEGTPLDINWRSTPITQQERVIGRMYTFHDNTPENTAARLRAAFLSRISHELRTPLTSISGFAQFVLQESGDALPDLAREYTEIILSSARHLDRVFTDLIEISRADAGEMKLHLTEAHLPDVIIEAVARLELQYKAHRQVVIMDMDDDLLALTMDVDRVSQVLTNLLNNAIKFSPEGGKIRISVDEAAAPKALPAAAPADIICPCVMVVISDEGPGLSKEEAARVFEPFFRTPYALKIKAQGAGLGLTIARSYVEAHRGKIWAEALRRGLTGGRFAFTLPR